MKPCQGTILHRVRPHDNPEAVRWCKTHQQEMLTGLRCATGWDEEITDLRTEIAEMKLRMDRKMSW